jgi:hypothetical protein
MTPEEQQMAQDALPTSPAPGAGRSEDQPTPSGPGDPRTNIEAEAAAGGGAELSSAEEPPPVAHRDGSEADKAADEDAELTD